MGLVQFEMPKVSTSIIKVIGVGGGGSNAVNHMFREGITDVSFVVCNTDDQALKKSPVPIQIQLGVNITEGLGAGSKPEVAREAAIESLPEIEKMLSDNTKMAFITAGMGGGTGTGAAPVIAEAAKKLGILTVGIVTIPFAFEGKRKIMQALEGVRQMSKHVDAILIINNEKLREIYPDIELSNAFNIADNVLANAAKGIAEIITVDGYINVDFADVYTIMKNGGVAVMNTGRATGEKRITKAIENALDSPLLDNRNVHEAKKILLSLYCSTTNKIVMEEVSEINEFMDKMGEDIEVICGVTFDEDLGDDVKITLIATGFGNDSILEEMMKEDELDDDEEPYDETSATVNQIQQDTKTKWMKHLYPSKTDGSQLTISLDDMDDDDIFKEMENIPAYKRNNK